MKRFLILLLVLSVLSTAQVYAQEFDIRNVRWGMSHSEVMKAEGKAPLEKHKEGIVYKVNFLDTNVLLTYFFVEEKVVAAAYIFKMNLPAQKPSSQDIDIYMASFGKLESMLTKKYGDSLPGENVIWTDAEAKEKNMNLKDAFRGGFIKFITSWETKYTDIKLGMKGGDDGSILAAFYSSKGLQDLIQKNQKLKEKLTLDTL